MRRLAWVFLVLCLTPPLIGVAHAAEQQAEGDTEPVLTSIFGTWQEQDGSLWQISGAGDGTVDDATAEGPTPEEQLEELQEQLAAAKAEKVYKWENTDTGEIVTQTKFKKLKGDHFRYVGEEAASESDAAEIARLERGIEKLKAKTGENKPLIDQYDPVGMNTAGGETRRQPAAAGEPIDNRVGDRETGGVSQSIQIRVSRADGHTFSYDTASFDGSQITARRTLRSMRDITRLPRDVAQQSLRRSPPEWIELMAEYDDETKQVSLTGELWRLHVTYRADTFGGNVLESIHTPYVEQSLALTQGEIKFDEAAARDLKF